MIETQERLLELLRDVHNGPRQLRPDEAMIAIELLFIALYNNGMAAAQDKEACRQLHMRSVVRMSSTVAAWPAKPHERQ